MYDNFIQPLVDALKYTSALALDVLSFCLLEALSNPEKTRMRPEETNISLWVRSLARFCAFVYRKYPVELLGVLQYVTNKLKSQASTELIILKELIEKMSGLESNEGGLFFLYIVCSFCFLFTLTPSLVHPAEITEEQLQALSGGETLKVEAGSFALVAFQIIQAHSNFNCVACPLVFVFFDSVGQRATQGDHASAQLLAGKQPSPAASCADRATKELVSTSVVSSPTYLSTLSLSLSLSLSLFLLLVSSALVSLIFKESQNMHLKLTSTLFDQCQETLVHFVTFLERHVPLEDYAALLPKVSQLVTQYHVDPDAAFYAMRPVVAYRIQEQIKKLGEAAEGTQGYIKAAQLATEPMLADVRDHMMPGTDWKFSPELYVAFWTLRLYDLQVPAESYDTTIKQIRAAQAAVDKDSSLKPTKRARERERLQATIDTLQAEKAAQEENMRCVLARLDKGKEAFFPRNSNHDAIKLVITQFLQVS